MRLDEYLKKFSFTRSSAKISILKGLVKVNGKIVKKPSKRVLKGDVVEVLEKAGKPVGYYKLKQLHKKIGLIRPMDVVLDVGSSAGGFLLFAGEAAKKVYGIEYSKEFRKKLEKIKKENRNINITIGNVFQIDPFKITKGKKVDLLLHDLTLNFISSIRALSGIIPVLKENGRLLMVVKVGREREDELKNAVRKFFEYLNLTEIKFIDSDDKNEFYVYAVKKKPVKKMEVFRL